MAEDTYSFEQARVRLEEIATQVKRKDTSLEKSLDLLEEGVRLANLCTEQIDHTQWRVVVETPAEEADPEASDAVEGPSAEEPAVPAAAGGTEGAEDDGGAGALDAEHDVPAEDSHAAADDAPAEDPDAEA